MPENVRRAIVEAIDSAEAVKASLAREVDPVLRSLANRSQAGLEARVLEKA
ncbi:MAG: hypothetical protein F7B18_00960 [Desulfurococcales archaeon]|nr:hypothetical protein [Desulfurococcales archaeon]